MNSKQPVVALLCIFSWCAFGESGVVKKKEKKVSTSTLKERLATTDGQLIKDLMHLNQDIIAIQQFELDRCNDFIVSNSACFMADATKQQLREAITRQQQFQKSVQQFRQECAEYKDFLAKQCIQQ